MDENEYKGADGVILPDSSGSAPAEEQAQNTQTTQAPQQPAEAAAPAQAPQQPAEPAAQEQPASTGYVNVGSSGTNTANLYGGTNAGASYTAPQGGQSAQNTQSYNAGASYTAPQGAQYTQSYNTGAQNTQTYSAGAAYTAPQGAQYNQNTRTYNPYAQYGQYGQGGNVSGGVRFQGGAGGNGTVPPQGGYNAAGTTPPRKSRNGKIAKRVVAGVLALALCFGSGMLGCFTMLKLSGGTGKVVVQSAESRGENASGSISTSASGSELSTSEVAALISPSVVVITTEEMETSYGWFGQSQVVSGAGSGVIMSEDGYILTCAHVVSGASNITVTTTDDESYTATVVGSDTESDIAVLKIDATGLTPCVIGDSDSLAVGESVLAVGNPLGELGGTVTEGIISALNRQVVVEDQQMELIQTSASVSPGNSGGGLFNMAGELIGIVNAKSSEDYAEGLGFAIPSNTALDIATKLIESGYVTGRAAMGVTVITIDESNASQYGISTYGVYIYEVQQGSAAEKAGLQSGDRIISIDNVEVSENTDLTGYLADCSVGDTVQLTIARSGQVLTVDVTLMEKTS